MKYLGKIGCWFFAICLAGLAGQQFYFGDILPLFIPFPTPIPGHVVVAYLFSIILIGVAICLVAEIWPRTVMLLMSGLFLLLIIFCHIPSVLWSNSHGLSFGVWTRALKLLSFAGTGFIIAECFPDEVVGPKMERFLKPLGAMIPSGATMFSLMLIIYGIDHIVYEEGVKTIVPTWVGSSVFWTYFSAVTLMCSGIAFILRIWVKQVGILQGTAIFIWVFVLHIPRAVADPMSNMGNELSSVFTALGGSGACFVLAYVYAFRPQLKLSR
jgi:uncharacterized membrane protein